MESSTRARALPPSACRSIRLSRTLTAANSAATKNARRRVSRRSTSQIMAYGGGVTCSSRLCSEDPARRRCCYLQLRGIGIFIRHRDRPLPVEPVERRQNQHVQRRRREQTAE